MRPYDARLSKTISHALRHEPWLYELELDQHGWTPVKALLDALREESTAWRNLAEADLADLIAQSDKKRYELNNGRIRALYGHSLPGKVVHTPSIPPELLFHGTGPGVVEVIRRQGLRPMKRQYVHLSADRQTAQAVGRRKSHAPVILEIQARRAHEAGIHFYRGQDSVFLADRVPPEYIL